MTRGEVYWARLGRAKGSEQTGTRPAIVVSRDAINRYSPVVVVVPISRRGGRKHVYPSQLELPEGAAGLTYGSIAQCEQVRAISKSRLVQPMGRLSERAMAGLNECLKITLDLS